MPQLGVSVTVPSEIGLIGVTIAEHEMTVISPGGTETIYVPLPDGATVNDIHADGAGLSDPQTVARSGVFYAVYTVSEPGNILILDGIKTIKIHEVKTTEMVETPHHFTFFEDEFIKTSFIP